MVSNFLNRASGYEHLITDEKVVLTSTKPSIYLWTDIQKERKVDRHKQIDGCMHATIELLNPPSFYNISITIWALKIPCKIMGDNPNKNLNSESHGNISH